MPFLFDSVSLMYNILFYNFKVFSILKKGLFIEYQIHLFLTFGVLGKRKCLVIYLSELFALCSTIKYPKNSKPYCLFFFSTCRVLE